MKTISKAVIFTYLTACPLTSAFAYNPFITVSLLCSILFATIYLFNSRPYVIHLKHKPSWLTIYWGLFSISFLLFSTGDKCINQFCFWSYSFFVYYYIFSRFIISRMMYSEAKNFLVKAVAYGVLVTCLFVYIEFISKSIIGFPIDTIIPRNDVGEMYSPSPFDVFRCRGFMTEPSHLGFYFGALAPIAIYWIRQQKCKMFVTICLVSFVFLACILTFSTGAFVCIAISAILYSFFYLKEGHSGMFIKFIALFLFIGVAYFVVEGDNFFKNVIITKFNTDNASGADRAGRFDAFELLDGIHFLFGYGPAAYSTLRVDSFISLVLGIIMNTGIIGLSVFAFFILQIKKNISRIKEVQLRQCLFISLVNCCATFLAGDLIYVPWFWIVCSFAVIFSNLQYLSSNK